MLRLEVIDGTVAIKRVGAAFPAVIITGSRPRTSFLVAGDDRHALVVGGLISQQPQARAAVEESREHGQQEHPDDGPRVRVDWIAQLPALAWLRV